ncbi:MAG TPA: N-acetylglucosamine-6-phosphate deacetylase [Acetobacteraceae bacterium]
MDTPAAGPGFQSAGLMDLQVNGYGGVDFNDEAVTADALDHALHAMLAAGVTACLPTVITAPAAVLEARLRALDEAVARSRLGSLMVPGYHVEGPFLNPAPGFRGCHPPAAMLPPDPALVERWDAGLQRPILLMTLAAELDGAEALIRWLAARGKVAAIGHSDAGAAVVARAADAGARMSTHLGNGLPGVLPKLDNPLMAQLAEDRLAAGFIADGIHLPRPALRAMIRAKGPGRAILVTDAVAAAGAPPGRYGFAGMEIDGDPDRSVRLPGLRTLAGSALTLDQAVRNVVGWGMADLPAAVAMASAAPAALLGPALAAHGISLPAGSVQWLPEGRANAPGPCVLSANVGDVSVRASVRSGRLQSDPNGGRPIVRVQVSTRKQKSH